MPNINANTPRGWLAFELSVLRRLRFRSLIEPFAGEPDLAATVKRWGMQVAVNDAAQWAWIKGIARIENNREQLTDEDVSMLLEDVYVPRHKLRNPALRQWFGETDAWWFDNLRENAEQLTGDIKQALALNVGMMVGDYALSFDESTLELRQPLSRVFTRLRDALPAPADNAQRNTSHNKEARHFVAEGRADLLFLRLPGAARNTVRRDALSAWREEWVRGDGAFWDEFAKAHAGRLGARAETKQQYLHFVEEMLEAAAHIKAWAISHVENGYLTTDELIEAVRRVRRVETIYTKDFSELMGARAAMITAL
ncbi:MAG: hypothetical protein H0T63_02880 [Pyrinomonadaceae bacterium]|nr:hypothetical protein [Pyrinomonadaceae bacterium]MDQ3585365.1 hypothetical protein [Acidobacteriota bacterium]